MSGSSERTPPQEARDYLKETFEKENPGSTLTIEEQQWTGLVDLLTTSLSSNDSPDVVEVGNTQAAAFTSAGAFLDLTDQYEALGGDDLLPGFTEAGSYDGKFYAAPYYSGARIVFYNTAQYATAGVEVPEHARRLRRQRRQARRRAARGLGCLVPRSGLVQRAPLHLGERWRGRCRR